MSWRSLGGKSSDSNRVGNTNGRSEAPRLASVKVMGRHCAETVPQRPEALGADGDHVVLLLERALDEQERLVDESQPVTVEEGRAHDHVDQARLVLQVQEHEAL